MDNVEFVEQRKNLGLTQNALGDALGKSHRQIQYYESGEWPVPISIQLAISELSKRKKKPKGQSANVREIAETT